MGTTTEISVHAVTRATGEVFSRSTLLEKRTRNLVLLRLGNSFYGLDHHDRCFYITALLARIFKYLKPVYFKHFIEKIIYICMKSLHLGCFCIDNTIAHLR